MLLMSAATVLVALATYFTSTIWFYTITFIARLIMGAADTFITIGITTIMAIEYPEKFDVNKGYL